MIPVRCFTCGKVLADKVREYERRCTAQAVGTREEGATASDGDGNGSQGSLLSDAPRGAILDGLGLTRVCCRICMLTHVVLGDDA